MMVLLKFIDWFTFSHSSYQNQQGGHVPLMWHVAFVVVWWHFHVAG